MTAVSKTGRSCTTDSVIRSKRLPMQAARRSAACVFSGKRRSFPSKSSTTLSVMALAWMASMFQVHLRSGERKQVLLLQGLEELTDEKWVASGLLEQQVGEWRDLGSIAVQRVAQHLGQMAGLQRRQGDLGDVHAFFAHALHRTRQGMGGIDFVVAIGADQKQVAKVRGQQHFAQAQRGRIGPPADRPGTSPAGAQGGRRHR